MEPAERQHPSRTTANAVLYQYGVTAAAVAVATAVRWLLDPLLADTLPFITVFGAVAVAVWLGGYRPALLATSLGYLACAYLFIAPRGSLGLTEAHNVVGLVAYLLTCAIVIGFGEASRVARRRDADQKERLRTTLASIGDGVITTDAAGRVTNLNAVAEALTGWANADARGRSLDAVFHIVNETTRRPVENPAFRALREGVIVGLANHTVLIAKDGSERPIDDSAAPIRSKDGTLQGCVLVFRDISDRKRAEDELQDRVTELETVLATVPACVWIAHDPACRRITGNRASADLLRLPADGNQSLSAPADQRPVHFKVMHGGAELPPDQLPVQRAAGGEDVRDFEEEVVFDDGTRRHLFGHAAPLRGEDGRVRGAVAAFVDISERKRDESLQAGQSAVLEMMVTGKPLPDVLAAVCRLIEDQVPGLLCTVLLPAASGRHTKLAVGPSLPGSYLRGLEELPVGPPYVGACGETLHRGRDVVVTDVRADQAFAPAWRRLLTGQRLLSCRSIPVFATDGTVLASFALHRRQPGDPTPAHTGVVTVATHLVAIAAERESAEGRRRASEERFRLAADAVNGIIYEYHFASGHVERTRGLYEVLGYRPEEASPTVAWWAERMHPDDRERLAGTGPDTVQTGRTVAEYRVRHKDGRWLHVEDRAVLVREGGEPVRLIGCTVDVTARKEAERERERVAATLDSLVASAPVGIVLFDADGRYRHVNGLLAEMNGVPAEAHIGKTVAEVVPALAEQVRPLIERVLVTGETASDVILEGETPRAPGVRRVWRESWFPTLGADGRPDGVGAIVQEITEQRRIERERENSQRTLATLVERCPFGIYLVDADFRIASVNAGSQDKAFANVRPLIGRPFDEALRIIWPEPVATDCINIFRHTLATGEPYSSRDFVSPRADIGETEGYEWELHRITLPDGRYGVVCYYFDATRLRRAEQTLRDSEAHFRSMADNAPAMLWVTDPTGSCTYISRQWCEFTGTSVGQNLGLGWLACVHPDDRPRAKAEFTSASESRQPFRIDYRLRGHDGNYRWAVDAAIPRFDGGTFVGYVGCVFDVHDRRMSEEGLREADRKKDEFLATLAHELRNPLAPIRNGLQVMKLAGGDPEAVEKARQVVERQVAQMTHLVEDLMDLSRISGGKIVLKKARMKLADAVQDAVDTARPLIEERGHELVVDLPPEPLYVEADRTRLAQVFGNLLNNAAKYTEGGGRIRVAVERQGGDVVVAVEDNGVGIPAHMLTRVFDMFAQVDRSLEKAQGGLGIGLNIVKRLVEKHGGSITAESDGRAAGSRFVVRLPGVTSGTPDEPAVPVAVPQAAPARRRILVVDDNRDGAESLAMMLHLMGNETRTAHDGLEAVAAAEAFRPDVILMDIGMPKLNGFDACRRIRERPWGKGVVVVAQTGWGQDEVKRKTREAGFDLHLTKPVDPLDLEKLLSERTAATG